MPSTAYYQPVDTDMNEHHHAARHHRIPTRHGYVCCGDTNHIIYKLSLVYSSPLLSVVVGVVLVAMGTSFPVLVLVLVPVPVIAVIAAVAVRGLGLPVVVI